jgi:hypothetical protein
LFAYIRPPFKVNTGIISRAFPSVTLFVSEIRIRQGIFSVLVETVKEPLI